MDVSISEALSRNWAAMFGPVIPLVAGVFVAMAIGLVVQFYMRRAGHTDVDAFFGGKLTSTVGLLIWALVWIQVYVAR